MDFNEKQILPPKLWGTFEDLCLELFRREWCDPLATRNGRSGQPQNGTDISGRPASAAGKWHGIQCKGKDVGYASKLTRHEIKDEAQKAKGFLPALTHWIIATTAPKDGELEQFARELTVEHEALGLFGVQVLGWGDIQGMLANHLDVVERFYPDQSPRIRQTLKKLGDHLGLCDSLASVEELIERGRKAAADDLQKFLRSGGLISSIPLDLVCERDGKQETVERDAVVAALKAGTTVFLEAEPGAGKSTTLLQVCGDVLSQSADRVPVCVRLPELVLSRKSLLEEIAGKSSFRDLSLAAIEQLAVAGKLILFCDGWNEITGELRSSARTELDRFMREFPGSAAMIATRPMLPPPFRAASTYFLVPLTRQKQEAILVGRLGAKGSDLLTKARRIPGLRDVLQVPLYLAALSVIGSSGALPTTKEEVICRFIEAQAHEPLHFDVLNRVLRGCHDTYLRALAARLIKAGTVSINGMDLRSVLGDVSRELETAGRISTLTEPADIIDVLVSHHVLVERNGSGDRVYSFQHQQFQEWYASFPVETILKAAVTCTDDDLSRDQVLDQHIWEEPLLFAVERMGKSGDTGAIAVAQAIMRATGIDPMLAAEMIQRSPEDIWLRTSAPIKAFASGWFATDERDRAVTFMMATGKADFAENVWRVIEDGHAYDQILHRRGYYSPAVLGNDWRERIRRLPDERRRVLLWDVASSGTEGIEFAVQALSQEHSVDVATSVLEILEYRATDTELASVLDSATDDLWQSLAKQRRLDDYPEKFQSRLIDAKTRLLAQLQVGVDRTRLLAELGRSDDDAKVQQAIDLALTSKYDDYRAEEHALEGIAATAPEMLSATVIARVIASQSISYTAGRFARATEAKDQQALKAIACTPGPEDHHRTEVAARLLTQQSVKNLVEDFLRLCGELRGRAWGECKDIRDQRNACAEALHHVSLESLVRAILAQSVTTADEIAALAELIFRWRTSDRENDCLPLGDPLLTALSERVRDWVTHLIRLPEVKRHHLSELACTIKIIARPELLSSVRALLDEDLRLWQTQREEAMIARAEGRVDRSSEASMSYVEMYRQALEAFDGEEARDVLLSLLDHPDFATQAAFALLKHENVGPRASNDLSGRKRYEGVAAARLAKADRARVEGVAAKAVLDRVDGLLASGEPASISVAVSLATAAAQMSYGARIGSLRAALNAPGNMSSRTALINCLLAAGEDIDLEWVRKGLAETIERLNKHRNYNRDDWWQVRQWLELFAFTPQATEILDHLAVLPEYFKYAYQLRDLAWVAPFAGASAVFLLDGLAQQSPELAEAHEWVTAFERIGTVEAVDYLIDLIADGERVTQLRREFFTTKRVVGRLLRKHPSRIARVLAIAQKHLDAAHRVAIAQLIGEALDEDGIMAFLDIITDKSDPLLQGLLEAVRELSLDKRPSDVIYGGYEQEPASLANLRKRLFGMICEGGKASEAALLLLVTIDRQRDTYGQPPEEPRHPHVQSGKPWPTLAAVAWKALDLRLGAVVSTRPIRRGK